MPTPDPTVLCESCKAAPATRLIARFRSPIWGLDQVTEAVCHRCATDYQTYTIDSISLFEGARHP